MVALNTEHACLHHLVEAQAARTPDAPALAFEGERLTYRELERRAGRLARHLREHGAGPDSLVGLFVERSLEMVVGILGVLKAGAAYVPIDTAYPPDRVAYMLGDAGLRLVLTQQRFLKALPAGAVQAVPLDTFNWTSDGCEAAERDAARSENLAYVIYTSGSTGRPKGVGIEHRNIVNYVLGVASRLRFEPGMHHAIVSTVAADLGNTVLFPALATGGCLHVIAQARTENQALLSEYFVREGIDVLKIVPSHLMALQSGSDPERVMPRRRLVLGGEASRLDWIARLSALAPQCEIHNHYGPTETTVGVLTYHAGAELPATLTGTLPLGRALPGSRIYLLDAQGRPVAQGEKGELCIGGRGVARGYLNRPDLTAERFVRDPFADDAAERMYRTGDLARALPDGSIEFCGRIDHQVKIRGYRVELGEIEQALREQDAVREAVVLARDDESAERKLVAYVVAKRERIDFVPELREALKARLPHYMVPSVFVPMESLPLNANGKVDRQALAAIAPQASVRSGGHAAPRTQTEHSLAAIWRELLQVEAVGLDDDVFDLGAHSLMAMKALSHIRETFGVNLALRNLFEYPTVAGLAEVIEGLALQSAPAARRAGDREEIVV